MNRILEFMFTLSMQNLLIFFDGLHIGLSCSIPGIPGIPIIPLSSRDGLDDEDKETLMIKHPAMQCNSSNAKSTMKTPFQSLDFLYLSFFLNQSQN
jgi:hypothetical protein